MMSLLPMGNLFQILGSLQVAVPLLVAIAAVLGWGTIYETRFGTAAVQRFIYQSGWFQGMLGFLAINLAAAALQRYPWKRRHIPFVLAHIGIISTLMGGIIGGRFGVEGQMIIPEGETSQVLQLPKNVLVLHQPNPGVYREFPTHFEATSWLHKPQALFELPLGESSIQLAVDRYYPNAAASEEITDGGEKENPAVHLLLTHESDEESVWLFARDPERSGLRWGQVHLLFLELQTETAFKQLLGRSKISPSDRGVIRIEFPDLSMTREVVVPSQFKKEFSIPGTPYWVSFKDYFADFAAVSFTLRGPEGTDAHILFALHPDFQEIHARKQKIHAHLTYLHSASAWLPPDSIGIVRLPSGKLAAVLTGKDGQRQLIDSIEVGKRTTHPDLGYSFEVAAHYPKAQIVQHFTNRSDEVRREAIHVVAQEGEKVAQGWVGLRDSLELPLGKEPLRVEYRPGLREIPFSVKLLDFRKIDYPGMEMAAGFESDVELSDPQRGVTLRRKISMNNPLKYRGFSFYQSSYVEGSVETTVLSVRNDPGTPLVYTGFIVIVIGIITLFIFRKPEEGNPG